MLATYLLFESVLITTWDQFNQFFGALESHSNEIRDHGEHPMCWFTKQLYLDLSSRPHQTFGTPYVWPSSDALSLCINLEVFGIRSLRGPSSPLPFLSQNITKRNFVSLCQFYFHSTGDLGGFKYLQHSATLEVLSLAYSSNNDEPLDLSLLITHSRNNRIPSLSKAQGLVESSLGIALTASHSNRSFEVVRSEPMSSFLRTVWSAARGS
jgi:hypothetical protein